MKLNNLINALKDHGSIIKATFSVNRRSSSLKLAVLRATTHDGEYPPSDARVAAVLALGNYFRPIDALMKRLHTTSSAAVAMKSLFTIHIIVIRGPFNLRNRVGVRPFFGGRNSLNLSAFRDVSDSEMNELSSWVRWYAGVVEQNVVVERKVDRVSELDVLVGFVERVCEFPESGRLKRNDLVHEVVRLVLENYRLVQKEIWGRVVEIGGRVERLSLDELTQLVGVLTRFENCRKKLTGLFVNRAKNEDLWELVEKTKGKLVEAKGIKEEKRMILVEMRVDPNESTRFWNPFAEPGQLLWVPTG